jgi:two-component system cell cycle sensor histidine kinase/response regulator CckA
MESLGYLVASITHDFNNLLVAMLGFTALLEARLDPSSEAYQYSMMVEKLVNKGVDLTQRLLTSGRKGYTENNPVDLNGAVLEVVRILEPMLAEDVTVDIQLQEEIPPIIGGLGQLQQAIMNLCLNAADAMPEGGRLGLSTGSVNFGAELSRNKNFLQPGHYVQLSITDTGVGIGVGISEEHLVKIFEPFFTTKGDQRGTGLGLSVVRGIVNEHGGVVQARSTLGQGSVFVLYLPASGGSQSQEADTSRRKAA